MELKKMGTIEPLVVVDWKTWETEVECHKFDEYDEIRPCGAILKISKNDLILRYFEGSYVDHYYAAIQCPYCGKYTKVKVPDIIWKKISTPKKLEKATFDGLSDRR